jgi:ABC-type sugar transport system substrate-binding protein
MLLYFKATAVTDQILIEWETLYELNVAGFNVQRSQQENGDFVQIGDIRPAEGDAFTGARYSLIDTDVVQGTVYHYRLEAVYRDGTRDIIATACTCRTYLPLVFAQPSTADVPKKIAFLVSDLANPFHQRQAMEAQKYAKDEYGAEVFIFDGKSDSATMTENVKKILAQDMEAASLHIWDYEAVKPTVADALSKGIVLTSFYSPLGGSGIPVARSDEAGVSFAMGAEMARKWKEANPDKPIVMVELGWPNHTEVKSGRTDPFVKGVLSVDPTAKDLGCQDASKGADAARLIIKYLARLHPEVNLIYSEAADLTVGTMAGLAEAGRGKMDNGKPLTEIVASADFDETEYWQVYDPNSSLKLSMGLPPIETGQGRIDLIMDVAQGRIPRTSQPAKEMFYKAYDISYWSMPQADAAQWLKTQFGISVSDPDPVPPYKPRTDRPKKIAFLVSDLTNPFHQRQAAEAQKYAKDKYGAEVFIFDGKSDSATMTANVKQILVQDMDAASLHIWDYESVKSTVREALGKGIVLTSFYSPLGDSGIPVARSDEKGVSFAMGAEMARKWKEAHPDKPIVMVELGWPNHAEVKSGRTDPFVKGVLSVDSTANDLGCQDASKGADAAKQIIKDLMTQHPEVNLIYSEAANLTVGTMAGLTEASRGKMEGGKPLTEIVASADFDESEYKQMYDPNSSLKFSMGLPPIETAQGRIDLIMDVAAGKIPMVSQPATEQFYKAYDINFYTMTQAEAAQWLNTQFGTNIK